MKPLDLTASGIIRALSTVDDAVRDKAEALASRLRRQGIDARVEVSGDADYTVVATGDGLFSREFGGVNQQPKAQIEEVVRSLRVGFSE